MNVELIHSQFAMIKSPRYKVLQSKRIGGGGELLSYIESYNFYHILGKFIHRKVTAFQNSEIEILLSLTSDFYVWFHYHIF